MMEESRWPALKDFDDCWPVRSLLKLTLKYGAEASRHATMNETSWRVRAVPGTT